MTDELKFFDPETGAELYRVPDGATIPKGMPYGFIRRDGNRGWRHSGSDYNLKQDDSIARFTREHLAPPAPPLPTEPGYYTDKDGDLWHVNNEGKSVILLLEASAFDGHYRSWDESDREWAPFTPVALVPTETWDRLRVLDPEDTRDRVDRDGDCIRLTTQTKAVWGAELAAGHWYRGPLRFADEEATRHE